jgi:hypothetical protein
MAKMIDLGGRIKPKTERQWSKLRAWVQDNKHRTEGAERMFEAYTLMTREDRRAGWTNVPKGVGPIAYGNMLEARRMIGIIDKGPEE